MVRRRNVGSQKMDAKIWVYYEHREGAELHRQGCHKNTKWQYNTSYAINISMLSIVDKKKFS